ncbi:T9SS type A sorting domain-containing protein [Candidatus Latescibacterota bacterium]
MNMLKQTSLFCLIPLIILLSTSVYAIETSVFPETIHVQNNYTGLVKIVDNYTQEKSSTHVATGDLNDDGFDDVIIGSMYSDAYGFENAGNIYIIFGNTDILKTNTIDINTSQNILTISGYFRNSYLGRCISTGDINSDGIDDLVFGANNIGLSSDDFKGNAYILLGNSELSTRELIDMRKPPSDIIVITGDYHIGSAASLGDMNGDGFDDVIVGASTYYDDTGAEYIIIGSTKFETLEIIDLAIDSPDIIKIVGENSRDLFGYASASGDINGDGFDDTVVGARGAGKESIRYTGKSYILWGASDFFEHDQVDMNSPEIGVTKIYGAAVNNYTGTHIEIGNIDNDNFYDIILESSRYNPDERQYAGAVYILKGDSLLSETASIDLEESYQNLIKFYGKDKDYWLGRGFISDINGDEKNDILLMAQGTQKLGEVYLLTDNDIWAQNEIDFKTFSTPITTIYGNQPSGSIGFDLDSADINGDGFNDIILGTSDLPDASSFAEGIVYILSGAGVVGIPYEPFSVNTTDSGNSSTILILNERPPQLFGTPLSDGSQIGVFTSSGICAGLGEWNSEDLEITVWGDNADTPETEGFVDSEQYYFRFQESISNTEYDAQAGIYFGDPVYHANEIVVLSSIYVGIITSTEETGQSSFSLDQNFPNPFNPVTSIPFTLPSDSHVSLKIFDLRGVTVETLIDNELPEGTHNIQWNAGNYPAGIYLYRLETGSFVQTKKMLLLK